MEDPGAGGDQVVPDDHEGPPKKKKKTKKAKPSINPLPADSADTPKKGKKKNKKSKTKVNDATSIPAPMENGGATSAVDDAVEPSATPEPPVTGDHGSKDDGSGTDLSLVPCLQLRQHSPMFPVVHVKSICTCNCLQPFKLSIASPGRDSSCAVLSRGRTDAHNSGCSEEC